MAKRERVISKEGPVRGLYRKQRTDGAYSYIVLTSERGVQRMRVLQAQTQEQAEVEAAAVRSKVARKARRRRDAARSELHGGMVYVAVSRLDPSFIKIGYTLTDIYIRPRDHRCNLLAAFPGGKDTEARLHRRFWEQRHDGEFFRREGALARWLDALQRPLAG